MCRFTKKRPTMTPFATLLHFKKDIATEFPRVLLVAPMSGHFATLLRATVRTMLPEHDVYITDWHNARDVAVKDGSFGIDDYADHLIRFMEKIGPGGHIVAVCQPCVPVLAAVAIMAEAGNPAQPRSMTLMAGPVDARVSPTAVNKLATSHSMAWFEDNVIATVPGRYAGANRRVYPGFLQLIGFVSMNWERHAKAHWDMYGDLASGKDEDAHAIAAFYDEYFAVADLPAEFYLQTVKSIFQDYDLARGVLDWHGRRVNPAAIEKTALLTIEAERDDVCGIGQTMAAHELCTGIRPYRKRHHLQPGVGHYGVFSGSRWTRQIYPSCATRSWRPANPEVVGVVVIGVVRGVDAPVTARDHVGLVEARDFEDRGPRRRRIAFDSQPMYTRPGPAGHANFPIASSNAVPAAVAGSSPRASQCTSAFDDPPSGRASSGATTSRKTVACVCGASASRIVSTAGSAASSPRITYHGAAGSTS